MLLEFLLQVRQCLFRGLPARQYAFQQADGDCIASNADELRNQERLVAVPPPGEAIVAAAALAASGAGEQPACDDPWSALAGYAHFHATPKTVRLKLGDEDIAAKVSFTDGRWTVVPSGGEAGSPEAGASPCHLPRLARWPGHVTVFAGAVGYTFAAPDPLARADEAAGGADSLRAPMPGLVKLVRVAGGEAVKKGQALLVLEAMKMEHTIAAPHDGIVAEIVAEGAQVTDGAVLVRFAED